MKIKMAIFTPLSKNDNIFGDKFRKKSQREKQFKK